MSCEGEQRVTEILVRKLHHAHTCILPIDKIYTRNDRRMKLNKPVGDCISATSANVVAMATRVGPTTFCMVPLNRPSRKPPTRPKHLRSICHTSRLIGNFVQILRSKFWALGGPKSKIEEQRFVVFVTENWWPRNGSIPSRNKKRRSNVCDKQTDRRTHTQTDRVNNKNNRLLARRGDQQYELTHCLALPWSSPSTRRWLRANS